MPPSEPALHNDPAPPVAAKVAYSVGHADNQNRVAQADHVAAHGLEPAQQVQPPKSARRVDETDLAKLVAEENASKSKFHTYPGLERWELLEKMGDGAFSNVYRARDLQGNYGEAAIKVVRKYEMNSMQVRFARGSLFIPQCRLCRCFSYLRFLSLSLSPTCQPRDLPFL